MLNETKVQKMIAAKKLKKQKGASMIEYALLIAGVVAIGAVVFSGTNTTDIGNKITAKIVASVS